MPQTIRAVLRRAVGLTCVVFMATSSQSMAQQFAPDVSFSGFGTLGYAILDDENAEYRTGEAIDGADDSGSFEVDTRLGLQMDVVFNPSISSTFQLIVREAEDGDAAVELEWGFLRWLATDNIAIRAGRMSLPVYSISDCREVGYAIPYLRPPEDLYSMIPLRRFNGADVTLDHDWGDSLFRWQLFAGQSREEIFDDLAPDVELAVGISLTVDRGPMRIRLSHVDSEVDIDSENANVAAVSAGIAQALPLVPALSTIADDFAGERVPLSFDAVSLSLNFSRVFFDAEYTRRRVDSWVSDVDGWSLAVGTRIGKLQPYVHISQLSEPEGDRRIDLPDNPALNPLEAGINRFYAPRDQSTVGIGARFDLVPNLALKAQIDRITREEIGISFNRNSVDDGSDEGNDVTLFSFALDFVF
ncbi:MAG: porin [Granulosicoccus sp.]